MGHTRKRHTDSGKVSGLILLLLLAVLFIFSAITKLVAIEPFEWTFMDLELPYGAASVIARLFIGFELLLGVLLLVHFQLRRFTLPLTIGFLALLSFYLMIVLVWKGNTGDCGCFGDTLPMSPLMAILKNAGLIALCCALLAFYNQPPYRFQIVLVTAAAVLAFGLPFVLSPYSQRQEPLDMSALYQDPLQRPVTELRKGKHLVAFMSLGCSHCRKAAQVLRDIYTADNTLPVFMVLHGPEDQLPDFFKETGADKVPYFLFLPTDPFIRMAGRYVPAIFWINNGIKERRVNVHQLHTRLLQEWSD